MHFFTSFKKNDLKRNQNENHTKWQNTTLITFLLSTRAN